eukprot:TRINITY_DN80528_c0_g1_i1.p1 TRINITY_DN80528_c0_g1~~TRINITY_DN80528_c0_g1_i1.p1  ORF type:complete len:248 (-),score=28.43 TRINITY_DN80528_c0_g1_i1:47-790(-)
MLVQALCEVLRRQARSTDKGGDVAEIRASLARAATELALLWPSNGRHLTKEEVAKKAGLSASSLKAFGAQVWAGWPTAFLSFDEAVLTRCTGTQFDSKFVTARSFVVAGEWLEVTCQKNKWHPAAAKREATTDHQVPEFQCATSSSSHQERGLSAEFQDTETAVAEDRELAKSRNFKCKVFRNIKHQRNKQQIHRIPWLVAPDIRASRSTKSARRMARARANTERLRAPHSSSKHRSIDLSLDWVIP